MQGKAENLLRVGTKTNKMVTYFNRKDLVSFGTYLLSEKRKNRLEQNRKELIEAGHKPLPLEDSLLKVYHSDIENWIDNHKNLNKDG